MGVIIQGNTFTQNSIPHSYYYTTNSDFSSNSFKLTLSTPPSYNVSQFMKESVPLIVRQADYVLIENNVFNGNSQGSLGGDFYTAQAITLHRLLGFDSVTIKSNTFINHNGVPAPLSDGTNGLFTHANTPIIAFNFWEAFSGGYVQRGPSAIKNNQTTNVTVENCTFYNN
jgi:hypothetical protein